MNTRQSIFGLLFLFAVGGGVATCDDGHDHDHAHGDHGGHGGHDGHHGEDEGERGIHGGRLLEDGGFAIEVTIFESGTPPQFRLFPTFQGDAVPAESVDAAIELARLGGDVDRFDFRAEGDYLTSPSIVTEPHSFDVTVSAAYDGRDYQWTYESHEGRTVISDPSADAAGLTTETAGPAEITEMIDVLGRVDFVPGAKAQLRARFPGVVREVHKTVGDRVQAGDIIARVESNQSLEQFEVVAPFVGVVLERNANVGEIVAEDALFVIGDVTRLHINFHVFASDLERVKPGQEVFVSAVTGPSRTKASITALLPTKEAATQTVIARAALPNPGETWMPGMTVRGDIVVDRTKVPMAVRTRAIQQFRDFQVVFAKVGETYEVRMLELGRASPEWTEVLGGIKPGQAYVSDNSYLIKADIEKSGASHDH